LGTWTWSFAIVLFFVRLSHLFLLGIDFEVADEGTRGRCDSIINSSQLISKHILEILIGVGVLSDGHDGSPVQEESRLEEGRHNLGLVLVQAEDDEEDGVAVLELLHVGELCVHQGVAQPL